MRLEASGRTIRRAALRALVLLRLGTAHTFNKNIHFIFDNYSYLSCNFFFSSSNASFCPSFPSRLFTLSTRTAFSEFRCLQCSTIQASSFTKCGISCLFFSSRYCSGCSISFVSTFYYPGCPGFTLNFPCLSELCLLRKDELKSTC